MWDVTLLFLLRSAALPHIPIALGLERQVQNYSGKRDTSHPKQIPLLWHGYTRR